MPKLIVSIDGVVIKELQLTKDRTALGRRPYNDIVIDNLAISGEHAVLHMHPSGVEVEDLDSTNGTFVNGKAVQRQWLHGGDVIELGKYKIRFLDENEAEDYAKTMVFKPGMVPPALPARTARPPSTSSAATHAPSPVAGHSGYHAPTGPDLSNACIRVLSGAAVGREVPLTKVVTTIGKPGFAVASITRRQHGYVLAHVEGPDTPMHNGAHIGTDPVPLHHGDLLELAGTEMQFVQH
ncbi:MAG: FHA domain-containing protein [Giesbergeria sp.]|uniref:FHA domain-containing protein n=1 Tax=Giesbergeria sp. TaxID=2818473 RepID=UPI00262FA7C7|nr:FHA domain-containing protein [Giesbergeria sp.]MDD2608187.1 FHA domain-containing protein [Giesbergeria sp.]